VAGHRSGVVRCNKDSRRAIVHPSRADGDPLGSWLSYRSLSGVSRLALALAAPHFLGAWVVLRIVALPATRERHGGAEGALGWIEAVDVFGHAVILNQRARRVNTFSNQFSRGVQHGSVGCRRDIGRPRTSRHHDRHPSRTRNLNCHSHTSQSRRPTLRQSFLVDLSTIMVTCFLMDSLKVLRARLPRARGVVAG
jgi:hypothetical protein